MEGGVGAGGRKEKPHNPLMISVQKVRIRPAEGKGKSDGWFPQRLTHNTRRVCTDDPENKLPMHSLCPTREWEREWYGVTTPNIVSGQGVILLPFVATPPLIGEAEEVVAAEPLGAFNRDPNDLVLTVGGKLVVNHLLEHVFLSDIQLQSLLDYLKAPIFNENPPIVGRPQDSGTRRTLYGNYGGANHHKHNPHKLHDLPVLKRVGDRVLETAKKTVVGGVGWSCTILDMAEISSYDHTPRKRGGWRGRPTSPSPPMSESAQGPSLPPPEGAPRGRTVLCCEGQAPSPVVHPGHPASPALSLPRVRAPAAPPYPPRVLVAVPMCEGTSSGLRLDAGGAACGGP